MLERFEDKYNWNKLSMTTVVTYFKVKNRQLRQAKFQPRR